MLEDDKRGHRRKIQSEASEVQTGVRVCKRKDILLSTVCLLK